MCDILYKVCQTYSCKMRGFEIAVFCVVAGAMCWVGFLSANSGEFFFISAF